MRYLGKTVLKGLLTGVAAGALTVGFASNAFAGALAYSSMSISNFIVLKSDGSQYSFGDFDVLQIGNFTHASAVLDGSGVAGDNPSDVALQCVGDCAGIGQNDFSQQPLPASHFSRGDAILTGSAIEPGGANASTVAEVQLNTDGSGSSASNTGTGTEFSFVPDADDSITFSFSADAILRTMLEFPDHIAFAGNAWSLAIWEGTTSENTIFSFAPECLNQSLAVLNVGDLTNTCSDAFEVTSPVLSADTLYTLVINHESSANASLAITQIPEPAAAALLGLGLLGLAGLRRRVRS